jgi:hypothetical protein
LTNRTIQVRFSATTPQKIEHNFAPKKCGVLGHGEIWDPIEIEAGGVIQIVKWETFNRDVLMGSYLSYSALIHKGW